MIEELADRIAARIGRIPASHGGYIQVSPTTLRQCLDSELLRKIAREAAEEAAALTALQDGKK